MRIEKKLAFRWIVPILLLALAAGAEALLPATPIHVSLETAGGFENVMTQTADGMDVVDYMTVDEDAQPIAVDYQGRVDRLQLKKAHQGNFSFTAVLEKDGREIARKQAGSDSPAISFDAAVCDRILLTFQNPGEVKLREIQIIDAAGWNMQRFLWMAAAALCLWALAAFAPMIGKKPEIGFLIVSITAAILFAALLPGQSFYSWDEEIHYNAVRGLSKLFQSESLKEALQAVSLSSPAYFVQSAALGLSELAGLPDNAGMVLANLANAAQYILVCYWAIRLSRHHKGVFAVIALLPVPMFLAASFSYDPMLNGFGFLGMSILWNELEYPGERLTALSVFWILFAFVIGCAAKAVYVPLLLLVFLLPKTKFQGGGQRTAFFLCAGLLLALMLATFMLPTMIDPAVVGDPRGGETSVKDQLAVVLSDPIRYVGVVWHSFWDSFDRLLGPKSLIYFGYTMECLGQVPPGVSCLMWGALLAVMLMGDPGGRQKTIAAKQKAWGAAVFALTTGLIFTAMYLSYTPVGLNQVNGVQGRYFLPLLPLLAVALKPASLENHISPRRFFPAVCFLQAAFSLYMIYSVIMKSVWLR